jgi:Transposase DDE domain
MAVSTNIGFVHDKGHREPWFIAMNTLPSRTSVLDYSLRWSIETLFADYKTRGFGLEDTHLQRPDRLSRLLLVLAIALYWATANGRSLPQKTAQTGSLNQFFRSLCSVVKQGLRHLLSCAQARIPPYPLNDHRLKVGGFGGD